MNSYRQKLALMVLILATLRSERRAKYRKRKNAVAKRNGEPQSKRLKQSESTSSSSSSSSSSSEDDDDSSEGSESTFDIFSSDSNSEGSSMTDNLDSDDELNSDHSELLDDISIKEEPAFGSDLDSTSEIAQPKAKRKRGTTAGSAMTNGNLEIKTEVLDGIVDAVEVDRNAVLSSIDIQIKEEPSEEVEENRGAAENREEPETNQVVGSSSDIQETSSMS